MRAISFRNTPKSGAFWNNLVQLGTLGWPARRGLNAGLEAAWLLDVAPATERLFPALFP